MWNKDPMNNLLFGFNWLNILNYGLMFWLLYAGIALDRKGDLFVFVICFPLNIALDYNNYKRRKRRDDKRGN